MYVVSLICSNKARFSIQLFQCGLRAFGFILVACDSHPFSLNPVVSAPLYPYPRQSKISKPTDPKNSNWSINASIKPFLLYMKTYKFFPKFIASFLTKNLKINTFCSFIRQSVVYFTRIGQYLFSLATVSMFL